MYETSTLYRTAMYFTPGLLVLQVLGQGVSGVRCAGHAGLRHLDNLARLELLQQAYAASDVRETLDGGPTRPWQP